ncbi:MAG: site-specific DNA-methyltransferase, partial [Gammaproteobacteria bacterium]
LRRVLSGELDYFLKSVVLNLDNLLAAGEQRAEPNFRLLDAVKRLGTEIVDFVSQLEDFQRALFEKKKFVLETSWCLTLDRIPASVKEEVYAAILANDRQWEEWEALYKISKWPADLATVAPRTREFLEAYPSLTIDTALTDNEGKAVFATELVERLLAAITGLDGQTDGLVLNGDNLQALRFLQPAYRESIEAVYIDPPYNTDASPIIYKNGYRRSSWGALLANRLELDALLRAQPSVRCIAIDDFEYPNLQGLLEGCSAEVHHATAVVRSKPQGRPTASGFSANHEYAVFWGGPEAKIGRLPRTGSKAQRYPLSDAKGIYAWANFRKSGTDSNRSDRRWSFYPVVVSGTQIRIPNLKLNEEEEKWDLDDELGSGEVAVYPIDSDGNEKVWTCSPETARDELEDIVVLN